MLLDAAAGDPERWHPVAGFGRLAGRLERSMYQPSKQRGTAFAVVALAVPVAVGLVAERGAEVAARRRPVLRPLVRAGTTALATWAALGGTSLSREGAAMANSLENGDLDAARQRLGHLCARDGSTLTASQLARATVESLAENTSDAVVAPLIWAAAAGVPGALGYRAANTLDAMVGYRSTRYRSFGWASARLDDVLNLVPARLTGVITAACAGVVGGSPTSTWRVLIRDAGHHPSPNAGWCEASAAGALGVRLGGANVYGGVTEVRPALGEGGRAVDVADIRRAVRLGRVVGLAGAGVSVALALAAGRLSGRVCAAVHGPLAAERWREQRRGT